MNLKVTPEDFVVAWMTSTSLEEVAQTTGLGKNACKQRAKRLRELGVKLKFMDRHPRAYDRLRISQLNSLVNKYTD